jgi:hypothetical protein
LFSSTATTSAVELIAGAITSAGVGAFVVSDAALADPNNNSDTVVNKKSFIIICFVKTMPTLGMD